MSSLVCKQCGSSDIDIDSTRGDAVCTQCGSVLEDQIIVSEVQFVDNNMGGSSVVGQYVSADGPKTIGLGGGFHHGMGKESRQITLENGKHRVRQLGAQLKLNQHCIDTAFNFYKMAVSRRLTRGRKTNHVIAACVYIVCRTEGTPHMLLDFSDVLQIDVYTLGRTYLQLSKELCINIPALDPCLYIQRFAHKLEFDDKTHEVSMTALRLVQRMKRDWMAQGRRPSGLCGAALLVAARVHDFSRHIKDIIRVVKIGEGTIRKRLAEFEATPSSQLTIEEFQKIDLEEEMDPPCFTEGKRKARLQQLEEQGQLPSLTDEIIELQEEIDKAIEEANQKKFKNYKKYKDAGDTGSDPDVQDTSAVNNFLISETLKDVVSPTELGNMVEVRDFSKINNEDSINRDSSQFCMDNNALNTDRQQIDSSIKSGLIPRPSAESLGINRTIEEYMKDTNDTSGKEDTAEEEEIDEELDLTGIDDDEIDKLLLSESEVIIKTTLWMKENSDYLIAMQAKKDREAKEREEAEKNPDKKKKRPRKKAIKVEHSTAADAIKQMLQEKKISSKINYDVLKGLNKTPVAVEQTVTPSGTPSRGILGTPSGIIEGSDVESIFGAGPIEVKPLTVKSFEKSRFKRISDIVKSEPNTKKLKLEKKDDLKPAIVETGPVIVESGPVQYHDDEHEEADEEYEEEEDEHISAAALMGHGGDDYYNEYGYEEDD